jgi:hypothetical protein
MAWVTVAWVAAVIAGCGDGDLSRQAVTSIPDGNAEGTAHSGSYQVDLYTSSCAGACALRVFDITFSLCSIGQRAEETIAVSQSDGHLRVDGDSNLYVSRLEGGIDQDGSFEVGGYATQAGGAVEITARVRGSILPAGALVGQALAHGIGSYEGQSIDCHGTYEISGKQGKGEEGRE